MNVTPLFKFCNRQPCRNNLSLIEYLVAIAINNQPSVHSWFRTVGHGMLADAGGTVTGQGDVPLGFFFEPVNFCQVVEKYLAANIRANI